MGDYIRSTRECAFEELQPALLNAMRRYIEKRELGAVETEILICCKTRSERKKPGGLAGLFAPKTPIVQHIGMLVTPALLIWAVAEGQSQPAVLAAWLKDIQARNLKDWVKEISNPKLASQVQDTGIEIFGLTLGASERMSAFIGLDEGAAAQKFEAILKEAVDKAHR